MNISVDEILLTKTVDARIKINGRNCTMSNFAPFDPDSHERNLTVGDVTVGEDGRIYAMTLDNSGQLVWTCIDVDHNMQAILISLLKTIKWSAHHHSTTRRAAEIFGKNDSATPKTRRKKTAYNKHIGDVLRRLAQSDPNMPRKERMRIAVDSWKSRNDGVAASSSSSSSSVAPLADHETPVDLQQDAYFLPIPGAAVDDYNIDVGNNEPQKLLGVGVFTSPCNDLVNPYRRRRSIDNNDLYRSSNIQEWIQPGG